MVYVLTTIDATSEGRLPTSPSRCKGGNESNHTVRASKTDVFFSEGIEWMYLSDISFRDVDSVNKSKLSNSTTDRLEWYSYDLAAHRITPNGGTYVLLQDDMFYKMQFMSYYNENDESRHISVLTSHLSQKSIPFVGPNLVVPSHVDRDF